MGNNRSFIPTSRPSKNSFLRARLYSTTRPSPSHILVHTRSFRKPKLPRFPCVESIMGGARTQAHVHDVFVSIINGQYRATFRLFFKRHQLLPQNGVLDLRGDIVVMRMGSQDRASVVNLRSSDSRAVDFLVAQMLPHLRAFQGPQRRSLRKEYTVVVPAAA
ncbi:hypothetical protein C8F04DRAFT_1256866 [Mycena alexandri]|uniref:Uncharacterized protein n=1 Tax=Mycena alexandri TaxID=1745969 RepID=A0AAD6T5F6_9AGAR|nr:hypothetical protein C8F04DRAFT_1256866 [Mycena alexandri]